jgi:hypothetical protein
VFLCAVRLSKVFKMHTSTQVHKMNLRDAYSGIYSDIQPTMSRQSSSNETLQKNETKLKNNQLIKNQQMESYHMFRNKLPIDMNQNAGQMFNGHNQQLQNNKYRQSEYQDFGDVTPTYYDSKNFGSFDTEVTMPTPLDNDVFYQYHTTGTGQGTQAGFRTDESNQIKPRKSARSDMEGQNQSLQNHFFTPMNGTGYKHNQDPPY